MSILNRFQQCWLI